MKQSFFRGLRRAGFAATAVALCGLGGCMVGPHYHAPVTRMPGAFPVRGRPTASGHGKTLPGRISSVTTGAAHLARWWKSFHDPELDSLIRRAVRANLSVRIAASRIRQELAIRGITAADLGPFVNASGAYSRSQFAGSSRQNNSYQSGLNGTWILDVFGGVRRSVQAATDNVEATVEDRRFTLITVMAQVASDYILLRSAQQQIAVLRQNLAAQRNTVALTERLFHGGFSAALNVANARAQEASTESQLPVLRVQEQQDIYALSVLLDRQPTALVKELTPVKLIPAVPPTVPIGLPAQLLRRRPDIRASERQLAAANAEIGVAVASLYPRFVINGNVGYSAADAAKWFDINSVSWGIGPNVNWAIFNSGQIHSEIRQDQELRYQAYLTYKQTVLTALEEVDNALVAYRQEQAHRRLLEIAVVQNQKALKISNVLYSNGLTTFLNVLQAQGALYATQSALVQSNATLATDLIALYESLGGGWQVSR